MAKEPTWYERSLRVIWAVCDGLPADADKATILKAVHDAYPYGERRMHPYKAWCRARRDVLAKRFHKWFEPRRQKHKIDDPGEPSLFPTPAVEASP